MKSPSLARRSALAFFCLLISISAPAQSSPYKPGSPLLMWKVSSKTNTAYVVGSVHLGDKSMYPLPAAIEKAFAASSVLIVEVDIRKVDRMQMMQMMTASGAYPPGDDLTKHISPETRTKLDAFLATYSMPAVLFTRFRPWMAGATIVMLPLMKAGLDPNEGIDMHFLNEAGDKRVEQLEDAQLQIKLLSEMPDSISDEWISEAISQAEASQEHWTKLATYWSHGAAEQLDELVTSLSMKESAEEKAFERRLREDRNPHMTERVEKCLHSTEACFMVVGAAHVVGSEGIVSQLKARGYRVEQAVVEKESSK